MDYAGGDGHIHELWWDASGWHHNDLTCASGAPLSGSSRTNGPLAGVRRAGLTARSFVGEESESAGHIRELWWKVDRWHHHDDQRGWRSVGDRSSAGAYMFDSQAQHVVTLPVMPYS